MGAIIVREMEIACSGVESVKGGSQVFLYQLGDGCLLTENWGACRGQFKFKDGGRRGYDG